MSSIGYSGCYQDIATHVPLKQSDFAYFVAGASGAVASTVDPGKVIASIVHNSTGNYTVTLNTRWVYLLPQAQPCEDSLTGHITSITQGNNAANAFTFTVRNHSGTLTDPASDERVQLFIEGSRRAEFTP